MTSPPTFTTPLAPGVPSWATSSGRKRELYGRETYFREAWRDIQEVFGPAGRAFAQRHTLMLLKPETLVSRQWPAVLGHLAAHGFTVRHAERAHIGRLMMRTLWAHQINKATLDRVDLLDLLFGCFPSVLLVLAGTPDGDSASRRLSASKGPPDVRLRAPEHLRSHLAPMSRLLTYVHACSETADFVRELGVLYERSRRRQLLATLRDAARPADAGALCERLAAGLPAHDLEPATAWRNLRDACAQPGPSAAADDARRALERLAAGGGQAWAQVRDMLDAAALPDATWDALVLGSHLAVHDLDGVERTLP